MNAEVRNPKGLSARAATPRHPLIDRIILTDKRYGTGESLDVWEISMNAARIGLHLQHPFHRLLLEPIYKLLEDQFECLFGDDFERLVEFQPRVMVVSDRQATRFRPLLPRTLFVWTRHGFSSKHYAATSFAASDFACVSSEWVKQDCLQRGWRPRLGCWVTGFVAMDGVLSGAYEKKVSFLPPRFQTDGPTVLYAPTYNQTLTAVDVLGSDWFEQARRRVPQLRLIIKPHPITAERNPKAMDILCRLARHPDVHLVEDASADFY